MESESNKETKKDKFNRVDLKVKDSRGEIIIIEVQYDTEYDYLQRILFGTSKTISEHMQGGDPYEKVIKVISVNILYFDLGHGKDYIYKGKTNFVGIHKSDELKLSEKQKEFYGKQKISDIYPEYYLIKVNQFNDIAKDTLDEWIYFLKNQEIKDEFHAKGLKSAKEKLDIMKLSEEKRLEYERYQEDLHYEASMFQSSYGDGKFDGLKEGKEKGIEKGIEKGRKDERIDIAKELKKSGVSVEIIVSGTGLEKEEVEGL